jgi:hypothetical protein
LAYLLLLQFFQLLNRQLLLLLLQRYLLPVSGHKKQTLSGDAKSNGDEMDWNLCLAWVSMWDFKLVDCANFFEQPSNGHT